MAESENAPQAQPADPDQLVGKVLNGRFKVLERIGSGGMGRVYKSLQAPLDRPVALKVLNPSYAVDQDPAFAKRFFLEASVTSKLTHPNTITIFDYGRTDDGIFFIAMEYLQGRTLHQAIAAEGCLIAPRAIHIARQICRALREAHGLGIVHRDLKPANVMLLHHGDDEDFVKVLDFGLVKFFTDQANPIPDEGELTQGGIFLGSPTYMAPEQARNESDPRSDVYSLGVVLYHMLAGRPPFQGKAPVDIILKHVNEPPPPFRPELKVPADLEAVVMRSLAKDPAERYQGMDEFLEALKRCGTLSPSDLMLTSSVFSGPERPPPPTGARPNTAPGLARTATASGARPLSRSGPAQFAAPGVAKPFHLADADEEVTERGRKLSGPMLGVIGMLGAAAIGTIAVLALKPKPAPIPAPSVQVQPTPAVNPPAQPKPAAPAERALHVESDPPGAQVVLAGEVVGKTPLDLYVPANEAAPSLRLVADGYEPLEVTAHAQGEGLAASGQLHKLAPTPAPQPNPPAQKNTNGSHSKKKGSGGPAPSGYKDDPYK